MLDKVGDIVSLGFGALAVGYFFYEVTRRRRQLHDLWDVLGGEDAALTAGLLGMVESGELKPYSGVTLA
jgi:hypothetical protein